MEKVINTIINKILNERQGNIIDNPGISLFDIFIKEILSYHDTPAQTIAELNKKLKRNKFKGPLFEEFCKKYMKYIYQADFVWLLSEIPEDIMKELSLTRRDYGIDLVMKKRGKYYPIQCKLKSPKKLSKNMERKYHYLNVTWKDLSTFYALCNRSGPVGGWDKLIVFTNTQYINRKGRKDENDKSICYGTLNKLEEEDFKNLLGEKIFSIEQSNFNSLLDDEKIRLKRLEYFNINVNK
jgi:hypothetical protein